MRASAHASLLAAARKGLRDGTLSLPMPFAIVASLLVHAVVLSITFSGAQPTPNIEDRNLEVVLVNARRERAPEQADVLAQTNLDGGGPVSEQAVTSTPTPVMPSQQEGNAPTEQRRIAAPAPRPVAPAPNQTTLPTVEPAERLRPQPSPRPEPRPAPVRQPPPAAVPEPDAPPPAATDLAAEPPQPQRPAEPARDPAEPTVALNAPRPEPPSTTFTAAIKPLALPEEAASAPATDAARVTMALSAPESARREADTNATTPIVSAPDPRPRRATRAVPEGAQRAPASGQAPVAESTDAASAPPRQRPESSAESAAEPTAGDSQATPAPAPIPQPTSAPSTPTNPAPPSQPAPVARAPQIPQAPAPPPEPPAAPDVSGLDLMDSIAAVAKLEARIGRKLDEYSKRPRKVHIGTRAKEYRFAQYAEDWRQKVERIGTLNYPDDARGRIYGSLVMTVEIRADGTLERVEIDRSSGHDVLDRAAAEIVRMAAPYAPFPPDIRDDTDRVVITRTWTFTNSEQVHTR